MAISGRFVILLALGVIPIVVVGSATRYAGQTLGLWLVLCLVLGVVDLLLAGSPRQILVERKNPARVRLGELAPIELYLSNNGSRTVRGIVRDAWQPSAGAALTRQKLVLRATERTKLTNRLVPTRRGERRVDTVTIRSFGPLHLWARQASLHASGSIRVLPPFLSRKHLPSRLARLRELDGATSVMIRGQGTEFDSLREYVRGDDVRSIDWRATARHSDVVVRTWRPERDRRVVIVIDTGRTQAARIENETRLDTSFEATLLLSALAARAGDRVDLLAYDRRVRGRVQGATGNEVLTRMVDTMVEIEPELIDTDWSAIPSLVRGITSQHSLVVLLTAIDSPGSSRSLLTMVPQLARRHTVVVAAVTDPEVLASVSLRDSREELYRAASAERALLDRNRVTAALRQLGAEVVTASPSELPPALADRYLALKAAGRL